MVKSTALKEILEGVDQLQVDHQAKRQFKQLVVAIGASHGVRGMQQAERLAFAARLLALNTSRATIRDRLRASYGVSRRQAYRIIGDALKLGRERASSGTHPASN
jgi:hypothetical protein